MNFATLYFQIIPPLASLAVAVIGVIVFLSDRKNKITIFWFLSCLFASLWSISFFLVINAPSKESSLIMRMLMETSGILVLYCWIKFVLSFLGIKDKLLSWYVSTGTVIMLALNVSPWFVKDMARRSIFEYYVIPDWGYYIFSLYFTSVAVIGVVLLARAARVASDVRKNQIKNILVGSALGFIGGGSTFLLSFNVPLPPYLFILFAGFPLIIGRGIVRYHLFNIRVIATELLTLGIWIFLAVRLMFSETTQDIVINASLLAAVIVFGILLVKSVWNEVKQREKIEKLAKDLAITNEKLAEFNERQKSLMKIMNHQIKGYLGKNRNIFAELLSGEYGIFPETAKPLLNEGLDQSTKGVEYVQGILRGASAVTGTLPYDMKPMDARQVAEAVIVQEKPTAEEKGLSFESSIADGDYHIVGDAVQLGEVFKNLITNAVKYNTPGGSVKVDLRRENEKIIFSVKDTGIGVSDEDKPKLFTFGGMGKNSIKLNVEAAGFGLAFVKGVAEAHKGIAGYKPNDSGKGSVFFVDLPAGEAGLPTA